MPELPEVETVCRGLRNKLLGDSILSVEVLRKDSVGYPSVPEFINKLAQHTFKDVRRRGKYILIDLDNGAGLVCHLRMTGRMIVTPKERANAFLRVRIVLKSGRELHFEDMRVFGRLWYIPAGKTFEDVVPTLAELGVEPLTDLSGAVMAKLFARRKQAVKSALLDQRLIAGVGNIYADESLFQAGIHPAREAGSLKLAELEKLAGIVKEVLECAITLGGSTLRDYTNSEGVNGNYQHQAWVYGRTGQLCRTCGKRIERMKIGGRSSHFCSTCQVFSTIKLVVKGTRAANSAANSAAAVGATAKLEPKSKTKSQTQLKVTTNSKSKPKSKPKSKLTAKATSRTTTKTVIKKTSKSEMLPATAGKSKPALPGASKTLSPSKPSTKRATRRVRSAP